MAAAMNSGNGRRPAGATGGMPMRAAAAGDEPSYPLSSVWPSPACGGRFLTAD